MATDLLSTIRQKIDDCTHKRCSDKQCECGDDLQPIEAFGRNNSTPDGYTYACKRCNARNSAAWKRAHPEKTAEWRKTYIARNKARNAARNEARLAAAADASRHETTD